MSWLRIDDQFARHPKVLKAGPLASWLHVAALCHSASYLTDGFIDADTLPMLAAVPKPADLARKLVAVGLWEATEGGWLIHDYLEWNPSSEQVKADREAARVRKARSRQRGTDATTADQQGRRMSRRDMPVTDGVTDAGVRGESPATPTHAHPIPSSDTSAAAANPRSRPDVLAAAAALIAERQGLHERAATKDNPQRWLDASVRGIANDHQQQAFDLLRQYPDTTAEQLADMLTDPAPRLRAVPTPSNLCPDCDQPLGASHTPNGCEIEQRAKAATR